MKKSILLAILVMVIATAFASVNVAADNFGYTPGIEVLYVKVNDEAVNDNATIRTSLERNQELEIVVKLRSMVNLSDVEVSAFISGYEYNDQDDERISDVYVFDDTEAGVEYIAKLNVKLPDIMDKDDYKLRVAISDRYSSLAAFNYNLKVEAPKHDIVIRDIVLNPSEEIKAGRSLLANVRIKNVGDQAEDDIKIKVEILELSGVQDVFYIDNLEEEESETSEDLLLRIPSETKPGTYTVKATVYYDNDHSKVTDEVEFEVLKSDVAATAPSTTTTTGTSGTTTTTNTSTGTTPTTPAQNEVLVNFDSNTKVLTRGEGGAIYSITVTNNAATAKSFVFDVSGVDWASIRLSPGNLVVVNPGESKAVYVYASANEDAAIGEHSFSANVKTGNTVVGTVSFKADVVEGQATLKSSTLNAVLMYLLIALVIVAVLVLIVYGVTRAKKGGSKKSEAPEFDMGQSYY